MRVVRGKYKKRVCCFSPRETDDAKTHRARSSTGRRSSREAVSCTGHRAKTQRRRSRAQRRPRRASRALVRRAPRRARSSPRGGSAPSDPRPPSTPPPRGRVRAPLSRAAAIRPVTGSSFQRAHSSSSSSSSGPSRPLLPRGRHPTAVRAFTAPRGAPLRPWRRSPRTPSRSRCRTRRWGRG